MVEKTDREEKKAATEEWVKPRAQQASAVDLRCLYHTRVVVGPERTSTRTRYEFGPGQVSPVAAADVAGLLALEKKQARGCCGSNPNPPALKYFELA